MPTLHLHFRITYEDLCRLKAAAAQDGLPVATLVRYAVADWLALGEETTPAPTSLCPRCDRGVRQPQ